MDKISVLIHLKQCMLKTKVYILNLISEVTSTITEALEELHKTKADKNMKHIVTLSAANWKSDSDANYPNYYDIAVSGVTADDRADILLEPESLNTAIKCGMSVLSDTFTDAIRIRAKTIPEGDIIATVWLSDGR